MNSTRLLCAALLTTAAAWAQGYEIGVIGGFGYAPGLNVTNKSGSATAGLSNGAVAGAYAGEDSYRRFGGEIRYLYRFGGLKVSSGGTSATMDGESHIVTGDLLWYLRPTGSRFRPFLEGGGGVKLIRGTGAESATQPLGNFVALTHTHEVLGVGDAGIGIKYGLSKHMRLRIEAHDYIGQAPHKVIAPAPGSSIGSIMNDIVGTASIGFTW